MESRVSVRYDKNGIVLHCGDCLDVMTSLNAESVDSIVTDPPYGIAFMGKDWDHGVPGKEYWIEALRVAKPGAMLLAFGGTRTYHRLACAIEDAGWEIRDCLMWMYGSGFPKSLDVSKAIDKSAGAKREVVGSRKLQGKARKMKGGNFLVHEEREETDSIDFTIPTTEAAKQWDGWGTALKPSYEPIIMARKPLEGTVVANVLKYGTGGINIDACRIGTEVLPEQNAGQAKLGTFERTNMVTPERTGRWPANTILDGSDEVLRLFPETQSGKMKANTTRGNTAGWAGPMPKTTAEETIGDTGSAARFFYTAKADSSERRQSKHPTVKPLDLMQYLVRLITPIGGVVFDPFMGSGSTIEAAREEHCRAIGIDLSEEYVRDSIARLSQGTFEFN